MKRDPALASLSRDHHEALVIAQLLRRATPQTADDVRRRLLIFWQEHGRAHFRAEEEILLPTYAVYGDPYHPLVARTLCDHVAIRQRAEALADAHPAPLDDMHQLGVLLAEHVRREERELFALIERALPPAALASLATCLEAPASP